MTHNTQEHTRLDFHCPMVNQDVKIEQTHAIRVSRAGKRLGRTVSETECSHKDRCGIAHEEPTGTVYDWTRCAFVQPQT
jgi:hypothetical protein